MYGKREIKYNFLLENSINNISYKEIKSSEPNYFFVQKDFDAQKIYYNGFYLFELFKTNSVGVVTARDSFTISESKEKVKETINEFLSLENEAARNRFNLGKDVRDWTIGYAKKDLINSGPDFNKIIKISYRPFDERYTYYTGKSKGFHCMPRGEVMQHFLKGKNLGLSICKQFKTGDKYLHAFISDKIIESSYVSNRTSEITSIFPLYLYPENNNQQEIGFGEEARTPNLNKEIVNQIAENLGLRFTNEKEETEGTFAPIDLLDYIYAVLHSPTYREKYKEFLKIDFPRVPYPKDVSTFWHLIKLGAELRQIHLLESPLTEQFITTYPQDGNNMITRKISKKDFEITDEEKALGRVWINDEQYFDKVPVAAWEFYIGGYQPAQKWLKDRSGRELSFDDILHYQKIIVALAETDRIMREIDKVDIEGSN